MTGQELQQKIDQLKAEQQTVATRLGELRGRHNSEQGEVANLERQCREAGLNPDDLDAAEQAIALEADEAATLAQEKLDELTALLFEENGGALAPAPTPGVAAWR